MYKRSDGQIVESGREARAGYRDRPVLLVAIVGTILALGSLLLIWALMT